MVVMVVVLVVRVDVGVRRAEGDIFAGKPVILAVGCHRDGDPNTA